MMRCLNKVHLSLVLEKGQQVVLCVFLLFLYHSWERIGRHTWATGECGRVMGESWESVGAKD